MSKTIEEIQADKKELEEKLRNLISAFMNTNPNVGCEITFNVIRQRLDNGDCMVTNTNVDIKLTIQD